MACGCGGSKGHTQQTGSTGGYSSRQEARRQQAAAARQPRAPITFGDAGFTWKGPAGSDPAPAK